MRARLLSVTAGSALALLALTGCVANSSGTGSAHKAVTVKSSADACTVSEDTAPAGNIRFTVTNAGDDVTEFYLLEEDGKSIAGEVENIGPGLSRELVVQLDAGDYFTVCKPGMTGEGVGKAPFTVTASGAAAAAKTD